MLGAEEALPVASTVMRKLELLKDQYPAAESVEA